MDGQRLSRRSLLQNMATATASAIAVVPVFISTHSRAADTINLTLPWIPEGEVAFMYAARKEGFWAKRGLDVTITRGFGSGEAAKNVGLKRYEYGQADIGAMIKTSASGIPLVSIAMVNQRSPVIILSLKGSGISKPKDLEGKRVSIVGFIHGAPDSRVGIKKFILLKNTQCKFGPGGQADHLTDVVLRAGSSTNYTTSDITVEGTLRIEPFQGNDGNTWSIYRLDDAQVR